MTPEDPSSFIDEERSEERREISGHLVRWSLGFALLFAFVFFLFWWSGSAVRFGASRVTDSSTPTYRVWGTVRNARTGQPIPWAKVEDHGSGNPPFYRADADQDGVYSLLTLAEPHRVRISASGYQPHNVGIGRRWFIWWPRGAERQDVNLVPEEYPLK